MMITETGKVIAIDEVQGEKIARIECISKSACSSCHNKSSCGVGVVSKAFTDKSQYLELPYKEGMEVNHFIQLNISNGDLVQSALLIYLVPLLFFIGSALIIKTYFVVNEGLLILIATLFAFLGLMVTRFLANKLFPASRAKQLIATQFDK